ARWDGRLCTGSHDWVRVDVSVSGHPFLLGSVPDRFAKYVPEWLNHRTFFKVYFRFDILEEGLLGSNVFSDDARVLVLLCIDTDCTSAKFFGGCSIRFARPMGNPLSVQPIWYFGGTYILSHGAELLR